MSVSDRTGTIATYGAAGIDGLQDLLTAPDFIGVRAALVKELGGDANRALVLTRIHWRADERWRESIHADGFWWWRATREVIAEETGLSVDQVKRILAWLVKEGYVVSEAHQIDGKWDQTRSLRVNVGADPRDARAESPAIGADLPRSIGAESPNPPIQTVKTTPNRATAMIENWQPAPEDIAWAKDRGHEVPYLQHETERFVNHFLANGQTKKLWGRAWRNWVDQKFVKSPIPSKRFASGGTVPISRAQENYDGLVAAGIIKPDAPDSGNYTAGGMVMSISPPVDGGIPSGIPSGLAGPAAYRMRS